MKTDEKAMLTVGTVLRGIYRIDRYLSSGGFGNTYVGYNTQFDEKIAIKEFFIKGVTARDDNQTSVSISNADSHDVFEEQNRKFKTEAKRLRKLKNDHIVGVHDLFEENGTTYYIMDYIDGENLSEKMKRTDEPLCEQEVWRILPQVLDALKTVHKEGLWHLDLKPSNIMMDKQGNVKLIDFGASKQLDPQKGGATSSTASVSYTSGYAPREQMEKNYEKFGPWTDIYALGATLYVLLTNKQPPLPSDIDDDDSDDKHEALPMPTMVSDKMRQLILWMMATNRARRPQSVDEITAFCGGQTGRIKVKSSTSNVPKTDNTAPRQRIVQVADVQEENGSKFNVRHILIACVVSCVLCIVGLLIWKVVSADKETGDSEKPVVVDGTKVTMVAVVVKSADRLDYFALGNKGDGQYSVVKEERNFTPAEDQVHPATSSDEETNRLNNIDAIVETIKSHYAAAGIVFIAQRSLAANPSIKNIDSKLTDMNLGGIKYYNPDNFSGDETRMVEEYVNKNYTP